MKKVFLVLALVCSTSAFSAVFSGAQPADDPAFEQNLYKKFVQLQDESISNATEMTKILKLKIVIKNLCVSANTSKTIYTSVAECRWQTTQLVLGATPAEQDEFIAQYEQMRGIIRL